MIANSFMGGTGTCPARLRVSMSPRVSPLGAKDQRLIRLVAAIVLGRWDEVEHLRKSAPSSEPDRAWREAVLMSHLFGGVPRLVEAYEVLERVGGLGQIAP